MGGDWALLTRYEIDRNEQIVTKFVNSGAWMLGYRMHIAFILAGFIIRDH